MVVADAESAIKTIDMSVQQGADGMQHMFLNDKDVTSLLRTPVVSRMASDVSAVPAVREFLLDVQRDIAKSNNVVMEGRDIGTVILPNATCKVFLTANLETRAIRRQKELQRSGIEQDLETVMRDMAARDYNDSHRDTAPLRQADDAILFDDSDLNIEETTSSLLALWDTRK